MRLEPNTLPNAFNIAVVLQLSRVSFLVKNKAVKKIKNVLQILIKIEIQTNILFNKSMFKARKV